MVARLKLSRKVIPNWSSFTLKKGQHLKLRYASSGLRSYLAIKGGFKATSVLNSVSTVLRNDIGSNLQDGSTLHNNLTDSSIHYKRVPSKFIPKYNSELTINVISGSPSALFTQTFTVSPNTDRTGVRLFTDTPLPSGSGIISESNPLGTIQLPPDGNPIILLNDRQTQGGYQKLGYVTKVDLAKIAQARPGTILRFKKASLTEAREAWIKFLKFFI